MTRSASIAASYLALVEKSGLLTPAELAEARKAIPQSADAKLAAHTLVQRKILTRWQATQILSGRTALTLGKYRLLERLGQGGMGSVYLAEHRQMKRRVAIKTLPLEASRDPVAEARLLAEAQSIAALDHRNIVHAYDMEVEGELHFLVMEYVEGEDLQHLVERSGPLDFTRAADFIAQAADGLAHIHGRGMVHRDIKPANLLLDRQGALKITDLGLAHGAPDSPPASAAAATLGTVDYVAPEQALGHDAADQRSDIYSLGCTFYFLLTGQPPFPEGSLAERLNKHQTEEPRSILKLRPDAPHELVKACRKMMAKKPEQRFASAADVARAIRAWNPNAPSDASNSQHVLDDSPPPRKAGPSDTSVARSSPTNQAKAPQQQSPANSPLKQSNAQTPRGGIPVAKALDAQTAGASGIRARNPRTSGSMPATSSIGRSGVNKGKPKALPSYVMYGVLTMVCLVVAVVVGMVVMVLTSSKNTDAPPLDQSAKSSSGAKIEPPANKKSGPANPAASAVNAKDGATADKATAGADATKKTAKPSTETQSRSVTETKTVETKTTTDRRATTDDTKTTVASDAFRDLPPNVELPLARDGDIAIVLTKIYVPPSARFDLDLLGGAAATPKGTGQFRLNRADGDAGKNEWQVSFDTTSDAQPTSVATVRRKGDELGFQWTPAAGKSSADYLRNCVLQLKVDDTIRFLVLRKPKDAPPLTIELDKSRMTTTLPSELLPEPDTLFFEIDDLEAKGIDTEVQPNRLVAVRSAAAKESTAEPTKIFFGDPKVDSKSKPLSLSFTCLVRGRNVRLETTPYYLAGDNWAPLQADKLATTMNEFHSKLSALATNISYMENKDADRNRDAIDAKKKEGEALLAQFKDLEKLKALYLNVHDKAKVHYRLIHKVGDQEVVITSTHAGSK